MDIGAASMMLRDARRELNEARVRVAHLEQVVDGLTGLLNAAGVDVGVARPRPDTLNGAAGPQETEANMRPRDAVLHVLKRRPGYNFTPRRIYDYLVEHGMVNTEMKSGIAAYDMALRRLAEENDSGVERNEERGTYIYRRGVTPMSKARNSVTHSASAGRRQLLDEQDAQRDLASGGSAQERELLRSARLAEEELMRATRHNEDVVHAREQSISRAERDERVEIERNRRELEEKFGIVTRPNSETKERGRDV
ncbi:MULTISPECIES: hypothetical protein [unclassified Microbacterium]|uniref:hypothetical protein n=1 Tax=unclassified Microbacterium TaxID=2609290 RepID=UPI00109C1187|nr:MULTISPECIES: hypothetical protein [unclassified Microbacterium]